MNRILDAWIASMRYST